MTVAIIEALELGRVLDAHGLDRVGLRTLSAARWAVQDAWDLATGCDLAHPEVEGPRPVPWRLTTAYLERLLPVAHRDPEVAAAFVRVIGILTRPPSQMRPRVLGRVLLGPRRAAGGSVTGGVPAGSRSGSTA
ncbi:hypothetical protein ABC795_05730 [Blastococcus sp. HT6-30]|uniref:hypothetical protein n=1 Tax=Blastococcus sp. HT6-30 TaxID=3144843 RepID=UPI00321BB613